MLIAAAGSTETATAATAAFQGAGETLAETVAAVAAKQPSLPPGAAAAFLHAARRAQHAMRAAAEAAVAAAESLVPYIEAMDAAAAGAGPPAWLTTPPAGGAEELGSDASFEAPHAEPAMSEDPEETVVPETDSVDTAPWVDLRGMEENPQEEPVVEDPVSEVD